MRPFFVGLQFLTRIKLVNQTEWALEDFGHSTRYFPLIGLLLGGCYASIAWLLLTIVGGRPSFTVAALITLLPIIFTGGLHADGLMDTADGLLSGRKRERILEIMKDSHTGAFGVVVFASLLLFQWSLLLDIKPELYVPMLLVMPVIGRLAMVISICLFPYPRVEGIGKIFSDMGDKQTLAIATATTIIITVVVGGYALLAMAAGILFAWLFCRWVTKVIGGTTGDVYGAVTVLTETLVLVVYLLASNYFGI